MNCLVVVAMLAVGASAAPAHHLSPGYAAGYAAPAVAHVAPAVAHVATRVHQAPATAHVAESYHAGPAVAHTRVDTASSATRPSRLAPSPSRSEWSTTSL